MDPVALSVQRLSYGLDGPGIESRWGEIFRTCPDRPWGPPSLLYNGYRVFAGGKQRAGCDADPSPPSSAVVINLYSPYRPYGMYRACTRVHFNFILHVATLMDHYQSFQINILIFCTKFDDGQLEARRLAFSNTFDDVFIYLYLQFTTVYHMSEFGKYFISIWRNI